MNELEYIKVKVDQEFPDLWREYLDETKNNLIGTASFNIFLKSKNINAFAKHGYWLGYADIRRDHYGWLKLKYE